MKSRIATTLLSLVSGLGLAAGLLALLVLLPSLGDEALAWRLGLSQSRNRHAVCHSEPFDHASGPLAQGPSAHVLDGQYRVLGPEDQGQRAQDKLREESRFR